MPKYLNLNQYQKETMLLALLLQLEADGKQIVLHERFIRAAQELKEQAGRGNAWQYVYNPMAGTLEYYTVKPKKPEKELSFADLLEQLTGESGA